MTQTIQLRRGTSSQWSTANPILATGEIGVDTTVDQFKLGDGVTAWTDLAFYAGSGGGGGGGGGTGQDGSELILPDDGDTVALSVTKVTRVRLPDTPTAAITFTSAATGVQHAELARGTEAFDTYDFTFPGDVFDPFGLFSVDSTAGAVRLMLIPSRYSDDTPYQMVWVLPLDGGVLTTSTIEAVVADAITAGGFATVTDITDAITALGLGTAATKNVAASGNAASGEVVKGNDTRLSDPRAPSGTEIHALTGKTTPVDADETVISDSAASNAAKKLTWANLKATLKTYFDTLYPSGSGTSSGSNTGDQTITLTGDVTGSGTGSFAATIGASKVTSSMIVDGTIVDADINVSAAIAQSKVATLTTDLAAKAPLASPTFTGTPAAPTASAGTNSTQLATTAYVDTAAGLLIPKSVGTTKGDLAAFDGTAWQRLAASASDGRALMTDSALTLGVGYKRPAAVISATVVDTTVVSSTAETTLASHTITGGTLVAGDMVRLLLWCDFLNNSGANVTYRWKVKFGSTTVLDTGSTNTQQGTASTRRNPYIVIEMIAQSGTAQSIRGHYDVGTTTSWAPVTSSNIGSGYGVAAEDTSTDKALAFTCQLGTSNAAADFIVHASCLELVKKR